MGATKTRKCPGCYTTRSSGNADDPQYRSAMARLETLINERKQHLAQEK